MCADAALQVLLAARAAATAIRMCLYICRAADAASCSYCSYCYMYVPSYEYMCLLFAGPSMAARTGILTAKLSPMSSSRAFSRLTVLI
jgi:hypothetical protein